VNPPPTDSFDSIKDKPSQVLQGSLKPPRRVFDDIYAFAPNRETLGGTAYLIVEKFGNVAIDCPLWHEVNQKFIESCGGLHSLIITHRGGMANAAALQKAFGCNIFIQEQEAYLLPELRVTSFRQETCIGGNMKLLWTPGHSPGSSCLYYPYLGGVLFSGRHLLPDTAGNPVPLKTSKTFHWHRQLYSTQALLEEFKQETLSYICPGANTGFLRGQFYIDRAYERLANLDLSIL
jgi:glyoxylase-like metal-dependent hydrolase (beta-lactamase superfamily II)